MFLTAALIPELIVSESAAFGDVEGAAPDNFAFASSSAAASRWKIMKSARTIEEGRIHGIDSGIGTSRIGHIHSRE